MPRRVSIAGPEHLTWLVSHDDTVSSEWVERCVELREYLLLEDDQREIGFLRWSWFWGKIPYMDMIFVAPDLRGAGAGRMLYRNWERAMVERGASVLMTSCEGDEPGPLRWHVKNGFEVVGELQFPGFQESKELFLAKRLA